MTDLSRVLGRNSTSMCPYITVVSIAFIPIHATVAAIGSSVSIINQLDEAVRPNLTGCQCCQEKVEYLADGRIKL